MNITRYEFWLILRESKNKKIIIYGNNDIGRSLKQKLELCDVEVSYFISDMDSKTENTKNVYELLYENLDNILVIIADVNYRKCERKLKELGLKEVIQYRRIDSLIDHYPMKWYLDVQLGHTFKLEDCHYYGVKIFGDNSCESYKIVTLGGSTTDPQLYPFASWSELLYQICTQNGHHVTVICAGVSSYTASQELLKLERDLLLRHPDMVISYSGVNDVYFEDKWKFASQYQRGVYCSAVSEKSKSLNCKGIFIGEENINTAFGWWLSCERMMYGICNAFNISFFGILQAMLGGKKWNTREKEIFLNGSRNGRYPEIYRKDFEKEVIFRKRMKKIEKMQYPFLHDFSDLLDNEDVFNDEVHVNEYGNTIIAQKIYELIEKNISEYQYEKNI